MDQEVWDRILAKINAPRVEWLLLSKELREAKKQFSSGRGATGKQVRELKKSWRSDRPFIDENGDPFVLYIYDQSVPYYYRYNRWGPRQHARISEFKYHFCWCSTIESMTVGGRGARYKAKKDVSNEVFEVNQGGRSDVKIQMRVCRNCLREMDYGGYGSIHQYNYNKKNKIFESFDIGRFFQENAPQPLLRPTHPYYTGRYTSDWLQISRRVKEERGGQCELCGSTIRLEVHHKNGVKDDNRSSNLQVLCRRHHSEQFMHAHMQE